MDYTQASLAFKLRKVTRYARLYGLSRTVAKVKGQYHVRSARQFDGPRWINTACRLPQDPDRCVAIIGCGNYAYSTIAYYLRKLRPGFLRATFDIDTGRAMSLCKSYGGAYAVADWKELLSDNQVQVVFVASNHATHAEYAAACIEAGKHVHIEKPHVVSNAQLRRLLHAMKKHPQSKVMLGFNRPRSLLFRQLQDVLAKETGPLMINWFIAGHEIAQDHWYFRENEGGRILGNLCHWTDLTLHLVTLKNAFPCTIVPATPADARSDFAVSIIFADQSCASITFSAKGHTFDGVREVLNVHKGNLLANLSDFQTLTVDVVERTWKTRLWHRDHGHGTNIFNSFHASRRPGVPGEDAYYVAATAKFFLAIREAIETGVPVTLSENQINGAVT